VNDSHKTIPIRPAPAGTEADTGLYEIRKKIYPRAVTGWFANWSATMVFVTQFIFYGLPWLAWNDRQAMLFDIATRKFYLFGLVFWPQDIISLAVLLIIAALSLFLFTAMAGRLWCGYACPQTVYTQIFLWVERRIEGDRNARIVLDRQPMSAGKVGKKAAKHGIWLAISLWTGITFVGYFTPFRPLLAAIPGNLGGWDTFWILFYGFATYGNAGYLREQVCKYMCPYARFQSVMFDQDTLVITYDAARGEPRGARSRKADYKAAGLGDCVDCLVCVHVCPTGIDIRKGLQFECIGCAACIDGCNRVMDNMGYPHGLIRYTTENALARGYDGATMWKRVFRARTLVYLGLLATIVIATGVSLYLRDPLKVDVIRDRAALARETVPGVIENVYRLQIMNTGEAPQRFSIAVDGVPGIKVVGVEQPIEIAGVSTRLVLLRLQAPAEAGKPGANRIEFVLAAAGDAKRARREKSTFLFPRLSAPQ
jgi:cytochrome c oxidase accessory protein FixG